MKQYIVKIISLLTVLLTFSACEKDGDYLYLEGFDASSLIASTDNVQLNTGNSKKIVLSLAWSNSTLQVSDTTQGTAPEGLLTTYMEVSANEDFSGTVTTTTEENLSKAYTGDDLNALAKNLGLKPDNSEPLFFRLKAVEGNNLAPQYSNVVSVDVTPYEIHMNSLSVLDKDKADTIAHLYSPTENGIYTGIMKASAWQNCWFVENDGTLWGNLGVDGHPFELSNASDAWNCWFSGAAASADWYVIVDTKNKEWSAANVASVKLNGKDMAYNSNKKAWAIVITTTADNTPLSGTAAAKLYDVSTKTDDAAAKDYSLTLPDSVIAKAGEHTVSLVVNAEGNYEYLIEDGNTLKQQVATPMPSEMKMVSTDGSTVLATLTQTTKGVYTCQYAAQQWENIKFKDEENDIVYGSDPSDLFTLSSDGGSWNIWFKDDFTSGTTLTVTVNLNTMKWSYQQ